MFLKEIEISGFKSFKERTRIPFDHEITGIVGPNGCGKSNIADAVRWALGEQSQKSLRSGKDRSDIVFAGNADHKASQIASVTLRFDNQEGIFPLPYQEVEISRKYYRNDHETVYYLNGEPCQLQQIQSLILDTGLGKDSLSIITQGNILSFAEAAPEARRGLFEEAAGVARYRRRKKQSLSRLEQTQANLDRVQDLISELESQLPKLNEQIADVRQYQSLLEELEYCSIFLLVESFISNRKKAAQALEQQNLLSQEVTSLQQETAGLEREQEEFQQRYLEQNDTLETLQQELNAEREVEFSLEKEKAIVEERLRLQNSPAALLASQIEVQKKSLEEIENLLDQQNGRVREKQAELEKLTRQVRQQQDELDRRMAQQRKDENRLDFIQSRLKVSPHFERLKNLDGIYGRVSELIEPLPGYEQAILTALGPAAGQVVSSDQNHARQAIDYLKAHHLPRTTFLPLDLQKIRRQEPIIERALQEKSVLGSASDYIRCDPRFVRLARSLLDQTLVVENMDRALDLSRRYQHRLRMVTLDGELFSRGGAMSGGQDQRLGFQAEQGVLLKRLQASRKETASLQAVLIRHKEQLADLNQQAAELENEANRLDMQRQYLTDNCRDLEKKLQALPEETPVDPEKLEGELLEQKKKTRDLSQKLQALRDEHHGINRQIDQISRKIRTKQRDLLQVQEDLQKAIREHARFDSLREVDLRDLYETWHITLENALQKVIDAPYQSRKEALDRKAQLESMLSELGEVNHQAVRQYNELNERYTFLSQQHQELENARAQLLRAVDEMDRTMEKTFVEMFDLINEQFGKVFQAMFGGGQARLVLTDPKAPLECGIDLEISPPGKKMKGLQAYSGGEKSLIAISVLFAILQARKIPLCIFDEVEAALDAANIDRFSRYVRRFRDQSQFIIITHRQGTMEKCDSLYGVTMQKDGVSKVLHVDLEETYGLSG